MAPFAPSKPINILPAFLRTSVVNLIQDELSDRLSCIPTDTLLSREYRQYEQMDTDDMKENEPQRIYLSARK